MRTSLARIRQTRRLRRVDVASAAGVGIETLATMEGAGRHDLTRMRLDVFLRVAAALGVSVAELVPALTIRPGGRHAEGPHRIHDPQPTEQLGVKEEDDDDRSTHAPGQSDAPDPGDP